jgi:RHS repeat-associated protein
MKTIRYILLIILTTGKMALASEQVVFYHTDPVGTPLAITNSTGAVVWQADYKPFGEENTVTSSAANEWRFVGKEKDTETGFSYFGARYQNAVTGRFIAVDPAGAVDEKTSRTNDKMLLDPQRLNSYAYGLNNPYTYIDPNGKDTYKVNRQLGGDEAKSPWNPLTHTFVAITDNNGKVVETYSWGNYYKQDAVWYKDGVLQTKWASPNQLSDMKAAQEAIDNNKAWNFGNIDNYVRDAYREASKSDYEMWQPLNNCKQKTFGLIIGSLIRSAINNIQHEQE